MTEDRPPRGGLSDTKGRAIVTVLLPDGALIRGKLPTVGTLLRNGLLPRDLVAAAAHFADEPWLTAARDIPVEERDRRQRVLTLLVEAFPSEIFDEAMERWRPFTSFEDLSETELDALTRMIQGRVSAAELTAHSRRLLGFDDDEEVEPGIESLEPFRGDGGGAEPREDGGALGDEAEPADGDGGPTDGVRAGRGAGAAADFGRGVGEIGEAPDGG